MLEHTFCHIPRVSSAVESRLWDAGYHTWADVLQNDPMPVPRINRENLCAHLEDSAKALENDDPHFFASRLSTNQHWRLFPEFRHRLAYLDIETTGLSGYLDQVTTIALYDGEEIHYYVQGANLAKFRRDVREYDVIVTYNGKCFDIPFLKESLKMDFPQVHLDLRYLLKRLGLTGGLKGCERAMGLDRGDLEGVDGFMAVVLWSEYKNRRNERALETLLAYNIQDVLSLEVLLVYAYNQQLAATPFEKKRRLPQPVPPPNPFTAHVPLVRSLMHTYGWHYSL